MYLVEGAPTRINTLLGPTTFLATTARDVEPFGTPAAANPVANFILGNMLGVGKLNVLKNTTYNDTWNNI